ncbi:c-type cytochrome [Planktotalea arctica]|uniref:c-type cytochrome n=1 Tax=Planktotalea arctica TaxID=1481893 RepID=UPI00321A0093
MRAKIAIAAVLGLGLLGYAMWPKPTASVTGSMKGGVLAEVQLPETLTQNAQIGKRGYDAKCAVCHGPNGAGQDGVAPPLVHIIYEPSHHGDEAFQRAAAMGVRAHHWRFGNMPAVEGLTRADVAMITAYVRELQRANGIN